MTLARCARLLRDDAQSRGFAFERETIGFTDVVAVDLKWERPRGRDREAVDIVQFANGAELGMPARTEPAGCDAQYGRDPQGSKKVITE